MVKATEQLERRVAALEHPEDEHSDEGMWIPLAADGHLSLRLNMDYVPETEEERVTYARLRERHDRAVASYKPLTPEELAQREEQMVLYRRAANRLSGLSVYHLAGEPEKDEHGRWQCPICEKTYLHMVNHLQSESYPHECSLKFVDQLEAAGLLGPGLDEQWSCLNFPPYSLLRTEGTIAS